MMLLGSLEKSLIFILIPNFTWLHLIERWKISSGTSLLPVNKSHCQKECYCLKLLLISNLKDQLRRFFVRQMKLMFTSIKQILISVKSMISVIDISSNAVKYCRYCQKIIEDLPLKVGFQIEIKGKTTRNCDKDQKDRDSLSDYLIFGV